MENIRMRLSPLWRFVTKSRLQRTLGGTNIDVRTLVNFRAADGVIRALLPAGWALDPPESGPSAGANLRVTFIDTMVSFNPAGKPVMPVCYMLLGIPVRREGMESSALMLFFGLSPGGPGPYGINLKATGKAERRVRHNGSTGQIEEAWGFEAQDGTSVRLQIDYSRGYALRESSELQVYSQVKPEFFRIYRYEQSVDVVYDNSTGVDRLKRFSFKAVGKNLSPLFDGTEQLVSVISLPSYAREVYLP